MYASYIGVRVHRIDVDVGTLAKPVRRADGTMLVEARIARSGVQVYHNPDGSDRREYRSDAVVNASMASFKLVPVTNSHPPRMLTADNATQYSVGAVGENLRRDGVWVVAPLVIHAAQAVNDVLAGKNQVSCGYECDLVMTPGVSPEGERYDCVQEAVAGNHLAIEHSARAGKDAAIRMDAAYQVSGEHYMDLAQALAALAMANIKIGELTARADTADKALTVANARADKAEGERDGAKERADKAEKERNDAANGQSALVDARVTLLADAGRILGADLAKPLTAQTVRVDGRDATITSFNERALKLAVIKHVTNADCSGNNPSTGKPYTSDYVDARYDMAVEQAAASADTFRGANNALEAGRLQGNTGRKDAESEYNKMVDDNRNGWKKGLVAAKS